MVRNIILVVHAGYKALRFLRDLEIDFKPTSTIDTQKAAQTALQLSRRYGLEEPLRVLSCPAQYIQTAGNTTNFTLLALLMLVVQDSLGAIVDDAQELELSTLQAIAHCKKFRSTVWLDGREEEENLQDKRARKEERKSNRRLKKSGS
jgi:hypothetical protein